MWRRWSVSENFFRFFFQPVDLISQLADFALQVCNMRPFFTQLLFCVTHPAFKYLWSFFDKFLFPAPEHVGMNSIPSSYFVNCLFLTQDFQYYFQFYFT